jgi:hypothetical protein
VWIRGRTPEHFESQAGLIQALAEAVPHFRLVMVASDPQTLAWLRDRFVDDEVLPAPQPRGPAGRWYLRRLRPALVLDLNPNGDGRAAFLHSTREGFPPIARPGAGLDAALADLLRSAPYEPPVRQAWRFPTWRDRAGQSRLWRSAASWFAARRLDDWAALSRRLGGPKSIMCLGNGPSSEDPRLSGLTHDCLMRVNWRWRSRGFLTDPDVVFVGDAATLHRLSPRVFGLWNVPLEYGMLLRYFVTHGPRRMEYFTMERVSPLLRDHDWPARPSNGALMVAAAAALRPERLIVAGLDLFRHPGGRYADDARALNEYSRVHSRPVDLSLIGLALKDYPGEVVVIGEALRRALEETDAGFASSPA